MIDPSGALAGMIASERHLFDIPAGIAYFNTATSSAQLDASRAALIASAGAKSHPWDKTPASYFEDAETLRALAAELFGGDADGWAVVPAASYGASTAARILEPRLKAGDEILVWAEEFPSNYLPWQRVATTSGATLTVVPPSLDWTTAVLDRITARTRVIALGNCHWTDGARIDLAAVSQAARRVGAVLSLDATQSLGAMPLDLSAVEPDFLTASGYKWLLFPYGVSLLYVAPRWRGERPLEESWITRDNARNFAGLVTYSDGYEPGARRFEVGEKCTALLPGAIAALRQLRDWTVPGIAARLEVVNRRIAARLEAAGFVLPPPAQRCPHMFGARLPEGFAGDFVGALRQRKVFVAQRGSAVRFSPHLHVSEADVEQLFGAVEEVVGG